MCQVFSIAYRCGGIQCRWQYCKSVQDHEEFSRYQKVKDAEASKSNGQRKWRMLDSLQQCPATEKLASNDYEGTRKHIYEDSLAETGCTIWESGMRNELRDMLADKKKDDPAAFHWGDWRLICGKDRYHPSDMQRDMNRLPRPAGWRGGGAYEYESFEWTHQDSDAKTLS